ncbi:MAG: DUF447 family protein [Planctomycetota bacterium]|nr:DUF447 family protein [Planctomycetota bacterium]
MILEAIITTENPDGTMHVSPMGPHVSDDLLQWTLKPFQTSKTFQNLYCTNRCVVHVVDDALLLARAVTGQASGSPSRFVEGAGFILLGACHWYSLSIELWDISQPRAVALCHVESTGNERPFFGWNRAKHAVVELAILSSRLGMLAPDFIQAEIERLRILIDKTAGESETEAFQLLVDCIDERSRDRVDSPKHS